MAKTWIETSQFYRKLCDICKRLRLPTLTLEDKRAIFPKLVGMIAHSDFIHEMEEYIDMLEEPDKDRFDGQIRVAFGDWYSAGKIAHPVLTAFLKDWIEKQPVLPDTYFIQYKTIEDISISREKDGGINIEISNEQDKWPLKRSFSLKQRFLWYRFLESVTKSHDQIFSNIQSDAGKQIPQFEESNALTELFKNHKDEELIEALKGRGYFILKYFVEYKEDKARFFTHRSISGKPAELQQDFFDSHAKGFIWKFNPDGVQRPMVKTVSSDSYDINRIRQDGGSIHVHWYKSFGVVEMRPTGAKTTDLYPYCAFILPNGELLMRSNFDSQTLLVEQLSK